MLKKFSDKIWWGDWHCLEELIFAPGAILNVAENLDADYWPRIGKIAQLVPYFRLARKDDTAADAVYLDQLKTILDMIDRGNCYPLVIHCQAGQHRSPAVAIFAQWRLQHNTGVEDLCKKMRDMHPTVDEFQNFRRSLIHYCREIEATDFEQ